MINLRVPLAFVKIFDDFQNITIYFKYNYDTINKYIRE